MVRAPHVLAAALSFAMSFGGAGAFACVNDEQCGVDGGVCQSDGWCSFADDDCSSGMRYGDHAGAGLGGACVPTGDGTGSTGSIGTGAGDPPLETGAGPGSTSATTVPVADETSGSATVTSTGPAADDSGPGTSTGGGTLERGLVAWYTFDDPADLFADASGNDLDGWCGDPECPTYQAGMIDGGIHFDGLDDHVHVDPDPLLVLEDDFSVAVWANVDVLETAFVTLAAQPIGTQQLNSWEIGIDDGVALYAGGGDETEQAGAQIPFSRTGAWHHVAFTWGGGELRFYVDGVEVGAAVVTTSSYDDHGMIIGADSDYGADDNFFTGTLDDVRIYARVLDETEVAELASGLP